MSFGAILEVPDPSNLKPLVEQAMPMLIELMKDNVWLVALLGAMVEGLEQEPRVASNVCWDSPLWQKLLMNR